MANVLVINSGSEGHINPSVPVVQELVHRGEHVVYYIGDAFQHKLSGTGVEVRTLPTEKITQAFRHDPPIHLFNVINGLLRTADYILPQILNETKDEHYDYILYDSMFSHGYMINQLLQLPSVSLHTSFLDTPQTLDHKLAGMAKGLEESTVLQADQTFERLKRDVEDRYNLTIPSRYEVMNNPADLELSFLLQGFQRDFQYYLEHHYVFVGPSFRSSKSQKTFTEQIQPDKPVIYISLGTVFNHNLDFFNKCIAGLCDIDATVIMSIGQSVSPEDLDNIPSHFIVAPYVSQLEVLNVTDVFLTHAGMNSTNEAIMHGVPLLAFPQSADQPFVARRIEDLEIGKVLNSETVTADTLHDQVQAMLEDKSTYQTNMKSVTETHPFKQDGYKVAADQIMNFAQSNES